MKCANEDIDTGTALETRPKTELVTTNAQNVNGGPSAWPPWPGLPAIPPPREPYPVPSRTPNDPSPFRRSPYAPRRDRGRPLIICLRAVRRRERERGRERTLNEHCTIGTTSRAENLPFSHGERES